MGSLFVKIYAAIIALFVIVSYVISFIIYEIAILPDRQFVEESDYIYQKISKRFHNIEEDTWTQRVEGYNDVQFHYYISLIPYDGTINPSKYNLNSDIYTRIINTQEEFFLVYDLNSTTWMLKIEVSMHYTQHGGFLIWLEQNYLIITFFLTLSVILVFLIGKITRPISHLIDVVSKFGSDDLSVRAKTNFPKPLDTLANHFNLMAKNLDSTISEQRIMIGAIPHELRTPIARVRFALDLTRKEHSRDKILLRIEKIDEYVDEMEYIVEETLEFIKLQNLSIVVKEKINVYECIDEINNQLEYDTIKIQLIININTPLTLYANRALFKLATKNIIVNALRHTQRTVEINVEKIKEDLHINIIDDGQGIDDKNKELIFSPFSTLDTSRNKLTSGIGLGLAMVRSILNKHNGYIEVKDNNPNGSIFTMYWPIRKH